MCYTDKKGIELSRVGLYIWDVIMGNDNDNGQLRAGVELVGWFTIQRSYISTCGECVCVCAREESKGFVRCVCKGLGFITDNSNPSGGLQKRKSAYHLLHAMAQKLKPREHTHTEDTNNIPLGIQWIEIYNSVSISDINAHTHTEANEEAHGKNYSKGHLIAVNQDLTHIHNVHFFIWMTFTYAW